MTFFRLSFCVVVLLLAACGDDEPVDQSIGSNIALLARDNAGSIVAQIVPGGNDRQILLEGAALQIKADSSGRLSYLDQSGQVVAKIKHSRDGQIQLKAESLLWSIKRESGAIQIADIASNADMKLVFKIKPKDSQSATVMQTKADGSEEVLYEQELKSGQATVKSGGQILAVTTSNVGIAAILSLEAISMAHKLIIINELLR